MLVFSAAGRLLPPLWKSFLLSLRIFLLHSISLIFFGNFRSTNKKTQTCTMRFPLTVNQTFTPNSTLSTWIMFPFWPVALRDSQSSLVWIKETEEGTQALAQQQRQDGLWSWPGLQCRSSEQPNSSLIVGTQISAAAAQIREKQAALTDPSDHRTATAPTSAPPPLPRRRAYVSVSVCCRAEEGRSQQQGWMNVFWHRGSQ